MKIIVVGGGIIGCASAYELAKAGCAVTLFERSTPGAEASGAAAGILMPLGDRGPSHLEELAIASWRLYPKIAIELRDRTGIDVEYVTRGTIYPLFTAEDVRHAEARASRPTAREFGIEAWDTSEARDREPALSSKVRGAMFIKGSHWVNNHRLTLAYAQAAATLGVIVRSGDTVSKIIVEDGHARGIVAEGERYESDVVLLAAGAWSGELAATFGARLPVQHKRGQMIALEQVPPIITHCVYTDDVYLVPRPSGELLIGSTMERVGFQRSVTADGISQILRAAIDLVPSVADLPITRTWCGFRPWAPDSLPIIGPWPRAEGLFVATAHFRNGIMLAPITAKLMTQWILRDKPSMHVKDFLPDRFVKG